jgi:hypothetical protein
MRRLFLFPITTLSAMLTSGLFFSAHADMKIIESNVAKYPVGAVIQTDPKIESLPVGGIVRVLRLPSNETAVFENPKPVQEVGGTRRLHKNLAPQP